MPKQKKKTSTITIRKPNEVLKDELLIKQLPKKSRTALGNAR
jgi:hypothetical protein